jgi:light-regulated signal transduction histidine kinase (bacteriophytochrome)
LGIALVFFGEDYNRNRLEDILLKVLSWVTLLLAVLSLLLIPLGVINTGRINTNATNQINTQAQQELSLLQQIEEQVQTGTPEQLQTLALELNRLGLPVDGQNTEQLRTDILNNIPQAKQRVQVQSQQQLQNQRQNLLKNSVKWNLGALVASVLFFMIWRGTGWAR